MKARDLIEEFRELADDIDAGYEDDLFWSDKVLLNYIRRVQDEACIRAHLIDDSTTASVCEVAITNGQATSVFHSSIIRIKSIVLASTGLPISRTTARTMDLSVRGWRADTGAVDRYIETPATRTFRWYRVPTADDVAYLDVIRLPLYTNGVTMDYELEVPLEFQRDLVHGMLGYAYLKKDSDAEDKSAASDHMALFDQKFGPPVSAKTEMAHRQEMSTPGHVRIHYR